jgi:hypothetical protein
MSAVVMNGCGILEMGQHVTGMKELDAWFSAPET